jgi:hypothetical protein
MLVTVVPAKLRIEPADMRAYDAWQDREGLVDATDAVKLAWGEYRPSWRKLREAEMAAERVADDRRKVPLACPVPATFWQAHLGVPGSQGYGHNGQDDALRAPYRAFRDRVRLSGGRSLWQAWIALGQGEPLAAVALGHEMDARYLANATHVLARWWREALG